MSKKELDVRNLSKFSAKEGSKVKQLTHYLSKNKLNENQTSILFSTSVFSIKSSFVKFENSLEILPFSVDNLEPIR